MLIDDNSTVNLTEPTASTLAVYSLYIVTGFCMVVGNTLLVGVILLTKKLRHRELLLIAGLAFGDFLYGIGMFSGGIKRLLLGLQWRHLVLVTPWECMTYFQTPFFIAGSQAAGFMMVIVSLDRLLAVRFFAFYMTLTNRYAYLVVGVVYGYVVTSVVVVSVVISYHLTEPVASVPALCLSTHVGPKWYGSYQPSIQMGSGAASILVFLLTLFYYNKQLQHQHEDVRNVNLQEQQELTRIVGVTVAMTFFSYVLPHGMILTMNTFEFSSTLAGTISPYGWVMSNINSMSNIFIFGIYHPKIRHALKKSFCLNKVAPVQQLSRS